MAFLKFRQAGSDNNLHWGRADRDGAPYRGRVAPLLRDEEWEEFAERVHDCKCGMFRSDQPDERQHGRTYQEVLDGAANGWFKIFARERHWWTPENGPPVLVRYIEWSEPSMQIDESRIASLQGGVAGGSRPR